MQQLPRRSVQRKDQHVMIYWSCSILVIEKNYQCRRICRECSLTFLAKEEGRRSLYGLYRIVSGRRLTSATGSEAIPTPPGPTPTPTLGPLL